jgi:hypothetical protein
MASSLKASIDTAAIYSARIGIFKSSSSRTVVSSAKLVMADCSLR